jgi:hypothetical protein
MVEQLARDEWQKRLLAIRKAQAEEDAKTVTLTQAEVVEAIREFGERKLGKRVVKVNSWLDMDDKLRYGIIPEDTDAAS